MQVDRNLYSQIFTQPGQQWLPLSQIEIDGKQHRNLEWNCLGRALVFYSFMITYTAVCWSFIQEQAGGGIKTVNLPLQNFDSNFCGLYCLYLMHYLVKKPCNIFKMNKNQKLLKTTEIDVVRFLQQSTY